MGKSSEGDAPEVPNPNKVTRDSFRWNQRTADYNAGLNRVDEFNPFGSSTYQDLGDGRWRRNINLSPEMKAALGNIQGTLGSQLDLSSLGAMPGTDDAARQRYEDAIYRRMTARLDPKYLQGESDLESKLANQGINMGSEAFQRERGNFLDQKSRDYQQAMDQAILGGGEEMERNFNMGMGARGQGLRELLAARGVPLQEFLSVMPQYGGTPGVNMANVDHSGNVWNAFGGQMNQYNQEMANSQSAMGDMAGLAGSLGGAFLGTEAGAAALAAFM